MIATIHTIIYCELVISTFGIADINNWYCIGIGISAIPISDINFVICYNCELLITLIRFADIIIFLQLLISIIRIVDINNR